MAQQSAAGRQDVCRPLESQLLAHDLHARAPSMSGQTFVIWQGSFRQGLKQGGES